MRIQHNIMAMNAYRNYNNNTSALSKNLEKLSSGYKINRAGDDAAGLAISEKMRAQITGLNAAQKNVKDGISLVKTAEGAMQEIQDMLNRMDYLATQSANGTYDNEVDRANLQKEVDALRTEIDRIADSANFNGIKLLSGKQDSQAVATDTNVTIAVTTEASGTTTGSASTTGGTMNTASYAGNFVPNTASHNGLHPGTEVVDYQAPTFTINLKDASISGVTNAAGGDVITVTVGGASVTVAVSVGTAGAEFTGASLAQALNGKSVTIGGVAFTLQGDATGTVTFGVKTGETADGKAAAVNAALKSEVEIGAGTGVTVGGNWVHGVQNIAEAINSNPGSMSGISFKLDNKIVADGNKLTIGDKNFVFVIGDDSNATTATGDIEIKLDNATDFASAANQIAKSVNKVTDGGTGRNNTEFQISAVSGDTIHLDQVKKTGTNVTYDDEMLKGLFSVTTPTITNDRRATLELSATPDSVALADGDMVAYNGKTYTIGAAPTGAKDPSAYMTAASFNEMVQNDAVSSLAAAAKEVVGDGYTVTVANGNVKITATADRNSDDATKLQGFADAIAAKLTSVKVSKIDAAKVGTGGLMLQIGDTSDSFNQMTVKIGDMHVKAMGTMETAVEGGKSNPVAGKSIADIDISDQAGAAAAVDVIKNAINYVSGIRGDLGAIQNRLEHTQNNLSVMAENIQDAESTIRDTDVADEMMSYVKNNILVQSAQAMLAQANQVPQGVLQLLG